MKCNSLLIRKLQSILLLSSAQSNTFTSKSKISTLLTTTSPLLPKIHTNKMTASSTETSTSTTWIPNDPEQSVFARHNLEIWPLDELNAGLLNEVHPFGYIQSTPTPHVSLYDE